MTFKGKKRELFHAGYAIYLMSLTLFHVLGDEMEQD